MNTGDLEASQILASMSMPPPPPKAPEFRLGSMAYRNMPPQLAYQRYLDDVKRGIASIDQVPSQFHSHEMYQEFLKKRIYNYNCLLEHDGNMIREVPTQFLTMGLCYTAVKQCPEAIIWIPVPILIGGFGPSIIVEAVRANPKALEYVNQGFLKAPKETILALPRKTWNEAKVLLALYLKTSLEIMIEASVNVPPLNFD